MPQRGGTKEGDGGACGGATSPRKPIPLPSYEPWQEREEDRQTFTCFLEDAERHRRERVREERQRRHGWLTVDVGPMMVLAH
jgi:hypothetical protein